jgi:endonuclease YncB( thermonuclease family)
LIIALIIGAPVLAPASQQEGLRLGEFTFDTVVDGDTIRLLDLERPVRLIGIDTEEVFKSDALRAEAEKDFAAYYAAHALEHKVGTPLGEDAKRFAQQFFGDLEKVRIERDHTDEIRDHSGRYLGYLFVKKRGRWLNYNIEVVRAGMSAYVTRYGYSRRFHNDFVRAENQAKKARRGIWQPGAKAYPDYAARSAEWKSRADYLRAFESNAGPNRLSLRSWSALETLSRMSGQDVTLIGEVAAIQDNDPTRPRALLRTTESKTLVLAFINRSAFVESKIQNSVDDFVTATGTVYVSPHPQSGELEVEVLITHPSQIQSRLHDPQAVSPSQSPSR